MDKAKLKPILEALIFASEEPLSAAGLTAILEETGADRDQVKGTLAELMTEYNEGEERGIFLREIGGGYQFVTKESIAPFVQKLNVAKPKSLSQAALETLSIIAYRQPLVRSDLEAIRGVDSGGVLKTLLERGFVKILGRREEAGQPLIYGTTPAFLGLFHLNSLEELPSMKEIEELLQTSQGVQEGDGMLQEGDGIGGDDDSLNQESILQIEEEGIVEEEEALADLEASLKVLRGKEREIFPGGEEKVEGEKN